MKIIIKILIINLLSFTVFSVQAAFYKIDANIMPYVIKTPTGESIKVTGFINFDLSSGIGKDGMLTDYQGKAVPGILFENIDITRRDDMLYDVALSVGFSGGLTYINNLIWKIDDRSNGRLDVITVDNNGLVFSEAMKAGTVPGFLKFQFPLSATLTPVPLPAAVWLFLSGLIGLSSLNIRNRKSFNYKAENKILS